MRIVCLCPHFDPDTAPTGHVMSRIVRELAARGHEAHVVTALPWYRDHAIEPGWTGRLVRRQSTDWGSITRVHPFPGGDRRNLPRRALGFLGFSLLAGIAGLRAGGWFRRVDAVIAMSPPLTLGLAGWAAKLAHRAPLVFNIQDVFPDAAVETGAITDRRVIAVARWLERICYRRADAVTVLSTDLADNVTGKVGSRHRSKVRVIPNFVDTVRAPSDGAGDAVPARAGDRRRAGRHVRRQRRLLAVARDARRRRPGHPGGHVRDQRSGRGPPAARSRRSRSRQRPIRRPPTRRPAQRGAGDRRRPRRAAASRARSGERPVQDLLDPRRRSSRRGGDRRRLRGQPDRDHHAAAASWSPPTTPRRSSRASGPCSAPPISVPAWGGPDEPGSRSRRPPARRRPPTRSS